jgi:hypothetical protein
MAQPAVPEAPVDGDECRRLQCPQYFWNPIIKNVFAGTQVLQAHGCDPNLQFGKDYLHVQLVIQDELAHGFWPR